jgi:hypothetical protein
MKKKTLTNNNQGFIKIHRNILNWEWYDDINVKVLFLHCLLKANYKDKKWHGILIKRGSFITSYSKLSKETKISIQSVRTSINRLKSTSELTSKLTNKYQIISVVKYDDYQNINTPTNKVSNNQLTSNQQSTNNQLTTTKEIKEVKEVKENKEYSLKVFEKEIDISKYYKDINLKQKYADFIFMKEKEYEKLCKRYGEKYTLLAIEKLNTWKISKIESKHYKTIHPNDYRVILKWVMTAVIEEQKKLNYPKAMKYIENIDKANDPELIKICKEMIQGGYMTWEDAQKVTKKRLFEYYQDFLSRRNKNES